MPGFLGLDVGGSQTRWTLCDGAGVITDTGFTQGFSGHLYHPEVRAKAAEAITAISDRTGEVAAIVAGVTGLSVESDNADQLRSLLRQAFDTPRIVLMNDIELTCRAIHLPGQGITVYAGTGSIGAHLPETGPLVTVGGKGVLIDDAGGGYWIAVRGLRHVLRAEDASPGSGWNTPLGAAFGRMLGGTEWVAVRQAFYSRDRGNIGMLALAVKQAADAGDPASLSIFRDAGRELALLARMLTDRVGPHPITLAGRAAALHPGILASMQEALPGRPIRSIALDAAQAAGKLASDTGFLNQMRA